MLNMAHSLATGGAKDWCGRHDTGGFAAQSCPTIPIDLQQRTDLRKPMPIAMTQETIVAYFDEPLGQHMLEEAPQEFFYR